MKNSRLATVFICAIATSGVSLLGYSVMKFHSLHHYPFLVLLAVSAGVSRFKLKLPAINGNMSVNLPFILFATAQLSLFEGMVVALLTSPPPRRPWRGLQPRSVTMFFNVNTMGLAPGVCL